MTTIMKNTMKYVIINNDPGLIFKDATITKMNDGKYKFDALHIEAEYCKKNTTFLNLFFKLEPDYRKQLLEKIQKDITLASNNKTPHHTNFFDLTQNRLSFLGSICYCVFYCVAWFLTLTIIRIPKELFATLRLTHAGFYVTGRNATISKKLDGPLTEILEKIENVGPYIKDFAKKRD